MTLLLGGAFLLDLFIPRYTQATTSGWQTAWEWELLVGGTVGLAGALWPSSGHIDDALTAESLGAFLAGFGFLSWALSIGAESHGKSAGLLIFAVVATGFIVRSWQGVHDRRVWLDLAKQGEAEARGDRS